MCLYRSAILISYIFLLHLIFKVPPWLQSVLVLTGGSLDLVFRICLRGPFSPATNPKFRHYCERDFYCSNTIFCTIRTNRSSFSFLFFFFIVKKQTQFAISSFMQVQFIVMFDHIQLSSGSLELYVRRVFAQFIILA